MRDMVDVCVGLGVGGLQGVFISVFVFVFIL